MENQGRISLRGLRSGREDGEHGICMMQRLSVGSVTAEQNVCCIAPAPEQRAAAKVISTLKQDSFSPLKFLFSISSGFTSNSNSSTACLSFNKHTQKPILMKLRFWLLYVL